MKFCHDLERLRGLSHPAWTPYWINYKQLKKLIKLLPHLETRPDLHRQERQLVESTFGSSWPSAIAERQQPAQQARLAQSPREVVFFKLLHSEFRKAECFFSRTEQELAQRKDSLVKKSDKKAMHGLYSDLLTLETYAIMTFCSFSKILKKHDKVTGYRTRSAYMTQVVEHANFAKYPHLLDLIESCRRLVAPSAVLHEDEQLFVSMLQQIYQQTTNQSPTIEPSTSGTGPLKKRLKKKRPRCAYE